jgi:Protein of unknown function (DUF3048) N-terminal domain/Protein of unknown function (DUF3048) C-terminal domain
VRFRWIVGLLLVALLAGACSDSPKPKTSAPKPTTSSASPSPTHTPKPHRKKHHKVRVSTLSGRIGKRDGRIYVVKIDNTHSSHPQIGLSRADIVYIEQVEGGATRLAAVYSSSYPRSIGPVRSARITDIELFKQYGHAALLYSGAQRPLWAPLRHSILRLASNDWNSFGYHRISTRPAPYNVVGTFSLLRHRLGKNVARPHRVGYRFGPRPKGGHGALSVSFNYPFTSVSAYWKRKSGRWALSMDGQPDRQANGRRLGPTTFVVQYVQITPSQYYDVLHNNTPRTHTVGHGKALFFRNGHVYYGGWSRARAALPTHYWLVRGKGKQKRHVRMTFQRGQLWVALVKNGTHLTIRR